MGGIGMIDGDHDVSRRQKRRVAVNFRVAELFDCLVKPHPPSYGALGEFIHAGYAAQGYRLIALDTRHCPHPVPLKLDQIHAPPSRILRFFDSRRYIGVSARAGKKTTEKGFTTIVVDRAASSLPFGDY
jgi:hypothetical protein